MQHAISAGHEITLEVAREVLLADGNAFDAAIAAHFAMFITEPCMASAGGSGFALTLDKSGKSKFFDFFCHSPKVKKIGHIDYYPITLDFGSEKEIFNIGLASAAVPGSIAGMLAIHKHLGKIPIKELILPACKLAKEGVILNTFQAFDLQLLKDIFSQDPSVRKIFFNEKGIKKEGDIMYMPQIADFLTFIAEEGQDGFYKGPIGEQICKDSLEKGGHLLRNDFEDYKVNINDVFSVPFHDYRLLLPNGPSLGSALLVSYLKLEKNIHPCHAIKQSQLKIADLNNIAKELDILYPGHNYSISSSLPATKGTSHFNVLDKEGNAISLTSSIGEGCGYFIPGSQMQLNNMLGETFLLPNGEHSWHPNTRLNSMMTPTILIDKQRKAKWIAGSGGATRIPFAIGQVLSNIYNKGMSLEDATLSPRVHFQNNVCHLEEGAAEIKNHPVKKWEGCSLFFGGVHSILNNTAGIQAIGDARRYGVADVF